MQEDDKPILAVVGLLLPIVLQPHLDGQSVSESGQKRGEGVFLRCVELNFSAGLQLTGQFPVLSGRSRIMQLTFEFWFQ
jgi:hypothetical protein